MRQKRAKAYRKLMHLYSMSFGFRQPYQVLVDSEMCKDAISQKLDFVKQLHTTLQGEVKPMITQCCIHELYLQGKAHQPAVEIAKTFERRKCNHREAIPGDECLLSVIGDSNKHRYVVATQLQPLRVKLRAIPATPLVHINRSVMVLEPPSDATLRTKALTEEHRLHATGASDLALVGPSTSSSDPPKKKKGPKGPNPLSVKKKKSTLAAPSQTAKNQMNSTSTADEAVSTGKKRKVDDNRDEEDADIHPTAEHNKLESSASKRRKRRRKTHSAANLDS